MSEPRHDILTHCHAMLEGKLDSEQVGDFTRSLAADRAALREYIRACHLHAALYRIVGAEGAAPAHALRTERSAAMTRRWFTGMWREAAVAAVIALAAIGLYLGYAAYQARNEPQVVWRTGPPKPGEPIADASLAIESGTAEFVLNEGVSVILDGRTHCTAVSAQHIDVVEGSATFIFLPGSAPMKVTAGDLTIEHIGTEFQITRHGGSTEVHVLDGSVRVTRGGGAADVLEAGEALRESAGVVTRMAADLERFGVKPALANAGFETAGADDRRELVGWTAFGSDDDAPNVHREAAPDAEPRTGEAAAKAFGRFEGEANYSGLYQDMPVEPGDRCAGSVWIAHAADDRLAGDNAAFCKIEFYDADGGVLEHHESAARLTAADETDRYRRLDAAAVAPDSAATVRFVLIFAQDAAGSSGAALFDDAEFTRRPVHAQP